MRLGAVAAGAAVLARLGAAHSGDVPSLPNLMVGRAALDDGRLRRLQALGRRHGEGVTRAVEERQSVVRCGSAGGGASCEPGYCCSDAGYCGQGKDFCAGPGCQLNFSRDCDGNKRPAGGDTSGIARPHVGPVAYGVGIYGCQENGDIAITYDDGPNSYTSDLLGILKRYGAKATFFVTGNNVGKGAINDPSTPWSGVIKRMAADGHQIASHTWSHQRLTELTATQVRQQMIYNEIALKDILGYFPAYMRPPFSASNGEVDGVLGDLGYHVIYFNLDTEGYLRNDPQAIAGSKQIWDNAVEGHSPSSTKYLHIEHDPIYQTVYNLTEYMLKSLVDNGFRSVTVGECLGDPRENWYRS